MKKKRESNSVCDLQRRLAFIFAVCAYSYATVLKTIETPETVVTRYERLGRGRNSYNVFVKRNVTIPAHKPYELQATLVQILFGLAALGLTLQFIGTISNRYVGKIFKKNSTDDHSPRRESNSLLPT